MNVENAEFNLKELEEKPMLIWMVGNGWPSGLYCPRVGVELVQRLGRLSES